MEAKNGLLSLPVQHNVVTEEVQPICVNVDLVKWGNRGGELCSSVSNFLKILNLLHKIVSAILSRIVGTLREIEKI